MVKKRAANAQYKQALSRDIDVIEFLHRRDQIALKTRRNRLGLQRPGHHIHIIFGQQIFKPGEFVFAPFGVIAIEEAANHVIRLAGSTMPCAKFGASQSIGVESGAC